MDGGSQIHGWLARRPARFSQNEGAPGSIQPARPAACFLFEKRLAGWPANHVFGSPHPFLGYIIGIGISLDTFSFQWWCFAYCGWHFPYYIHIFALRPRRRALLPLSCDFDAGLSQLRHSRRAGRLNGSGRPFLLKNLADRLARQPCIWLPPSIMGGIILVLVYHWIHFPFYG